MIVPTGCSVASAEPLMRIVAGCTAMTMLVMPPVIVVVIREPLLTPMIMIVMGNAMFAERLAA
jgi:hypothetical protein